MFYKTSLSCLLLLFVGSCQSVEHEQSIINNSKVIELKRLSSSTMLPLSDRNNSQGWLLNNLVSDEFNGNKVDESKWYVQGKNQAFYLWKGRAPSQFAPHNVNVKDGKLLITTQWEPDYAFVGKPPKKQAAEGYKYENITTGAVIAQNSFLHGYMEVKVKIPAAAMTGAFWATGYQSEIDIFEHVGKVKIGNANVEKKFTTSIHDWRPGHAAKNKVWKTTHPIDFDMTADFHVFGVEWNDDKLSVFIDGKLVNTTTKKEMGDAWVLNNPLELWFDSEVFPWHGVPEAADLPVNFEIDYVRVWQKPKSNLLDRAFYSFEGPFLTQKTLKPNRREKHAQSWFIKDADQSLFSITLDKDFKYSNGRKSLKFSQQNEFEQNDITAFSPYGSVALPSGKFNLSMDVWIEPKSIIERVDVTLEAPWKWLTAIDLTSIEKGKWVTVSTTFERKQASKDKDRLRIVLFKKYLKGMNNTLYIDNIRITEQSDNK